MKINEHKAKDILYLDVIEKWTGGGGWGGGGDRGKEVSSQPDQGGGLRLRFLDQTSPSRLVGVVEC